MRRPFQGVRNVFLFNWPYYAVGAGFLSILIAGSQILADPASTVLAILAGIILLLVAISLLVTVYVYDLSALYEMYWLDNVLDEKVGLIANFTAGFDETSDLLADRFRNSELTVFDFFDPKRHTEPSIRRARKAYPPFPGTQIISTNTIPLANDSAAAIFAFLSAHEIREPSDRASFFTELRRVVSPNGQVIVVEHLRAAANFLAYNIGALHFHSRSAWLATFRDAELKIENEIKITPFITVFFLKKIGA